MVAQFAVWNVEHRSIVHLCPIGITRKKNELRLRIDKIFDQPRASDAIDFNLFTSDPLHHLDCLSLCQKLQPDVAHGGCVSNNVSSAGEDQVAVLAQLPATANIKRYLRTSAMLLG